MDENLERLEQIPTVPGMGRSLIHHDLRSRAFRAIDLVDDATLHTKTWRRGGAYDQGQTSTCVAQTGKGLMNSLPMSEQVSYDIRREYSTDEWYQGAQRYDEWEGADYDGTSALGLCRYLTELGIIREYRWCFGLVDVLVTLSHVGPVGIGIWWHADMFFPDSRGLIRPTGGLEGGHEVELIGVDTRRREVIGMNSWGEDWGDRGRFRLTWDSLGSLLAEDGDAVVILQ